MEEHRRFFSKQILRRFLSQEIINRFSDKVLSVEKYREISSEIRKQVSRSKHLPGTVRTLGAKSARETRGFQVLE